MTDPFFDWPNRSVQERVIARTMLEHAGFEVSACKSCDDDPPDCDGTLDGVRSAIEVTRLTHEKARAQSIKAQRERAAGRDPEKPEVYFLREREDLLRELQNDTIAAESQSTITCGCGSQRVVLSGCCQTKIGFGAVKLSH
ncbi:MAG TPA: hypothetical protein VI077_04905 [Pseudolabrys sp.]